MHEPLLFTMLKLALKTTHNKQFLDIFSYVLLYYYSVYYCSVLNLQERAQATPELLHDYVK